MRLPKEIRDRFKAAGKEGGQIGGKAKVAKGFAKMTPEKRAAALAASIKTRRKKKPKA